MHKFVFFLVLFTSAFTSVCQTTTLTNTDVVKLNSSKVGEKVILSKIQTSDVSFDISTDAIVALKQSGVSEVIIEAMVSKQSKLNSAKSKSQSSSSSSSGYVFPRSGIYFENSQSKFTELDATLVTSTKTDGNCLSNCLLVYGIGAKKNVSSLEGSEANYQLESKPKIYFCFTAEKKDLNSTKPNDYFSQITGNQTAVSPNEFRLIKLDVNGNSRSYVSSSVKASTGIADVSISDEYIVNFKYVQVADDTYELSFPNGLEKGEYCFYYLNNSSTNPYAHAGYNNIKVYDFSVK